MHVQPGLCQTWLEPKLLVFSRTGLYVYHVGRGSGVRGVGRGMRRGSPVKGRGPVVFSRTPRGRGRGARAGRGRGGAANLSGMSPLNRSMVSETPALS